MKPLLRLGIALAALVVVVPVAAEELLRAETDDWVLTAPAVLGSEADLELNARGTQLCHDEIERVIGHRPRTSGKFTMTWQIGGGPISYALPTGVVSLVPSADWRLVDPDAFGFRQRLVDERICFGPHEITHVLSWESFGARWANEGFATFTDRLYDSTTWGCCTEPVRTRQSCDETGYTYGPERHGYADLSPFTVDTVSYHTAACYWWEVHRRGGLFAIRGVLASMRRAPPRSAGEVVEHANLVLNAELRPALMRYGFTTEELAAAPLTRAGLACTLIGTAAGDGIGGTPGLDLICGLGGADRLAGHAGADVILGGAAADVLSGGPGRDRLDGGAGNDLIEARDGLRDVVLGGPGRDRARVDRALDRIVGVETVLR